MSPPRRIWQFPFWYCESLLQQLTRSNVEKRYKDSPMGDFPWILKSSHHNLQPLDIIMKLPLSFFLCFAVTISASFETLALDKDGAILTVTINNTQSAVNLMRLETVREIGQLVTSLQNDNSTKVVIFKSGNSEFFSAHYDLFAEPGESLSDLEATVLRHADPMKSYRRAQPKRTWNCSNSGRNIPEYEQPASACDWHGQWPCSRYSK